MFHDIINGQILTIFNLSDKVFNIYRYLLGRSLTDYPAVPALQGRGGTGDRTVGAVLVASLAGHGRGEGGAGAPCGGRGGAAGQGGAGADPLVLALPHKHIHTRHVQWLNIHVRI